MHPSLVHSSSLSSQILSLLIHSGSTSPLSAMPGELESGLPQIDPRILIFLLYMVILQELVSGWMEYKKLACKPKKKPGPVWSSRIPGVPLCRYPSSQTESEMRSDNPVPTLLLLARRMVAWSSRRM